jgi:hypothetical protein
LQHLHQLLDKLREFGLVMEFKKCQFARPSVDFMGTIFLQLLHSLSFSMHIKEVQWPVDSKGLQSFFELVNF